MMNFDKCSLQKIGAIIIEFRFTDSLCKGIEKCEYESVLIQSTKVLGCLQLLQDVLSQFQSDEN